MRVQAEIKYGTKTALDINIELENDKSYALIGANGSGKSTLIKVLAGFIHDKSAKLEGLTDNILYMPQNSYGFTFSVRRNVSTAYPFWRELARHRKQNRDSLIRLIKQERLIKKRTVSKIITDMELTPLIKKNGSRLSGGETQRVALSRLLAAKGELLLLDEPTSSMDIKQALICEKALLEVKKSSRLIFATHSIAQAEKLADEVIFLYDGKVIERLSAKDFCNSATQNETKEFLQYLYNIKTEDK